MSMTATQVQLKVEALEARLTPDATTYVQGLYQDVLQRTAEPAGLEFWSTQLNTGRLSNTEVAAAFWFSEEHRTLQVTEYYQRFFHRAPDPAGLDNWVDKFLDGASEYEVIQMFLTSNEYVALHPTPNAYVRGLYEDVLGRTPTDAEVNSWVQHLQDEDGFDDSQSDDDSDNDPFDSADIEGTDDVVEGFLTSDEYFLLVIDQYYTDLLHRLPDPVGQQGWLNVLRNGNVEDGNVDDIQDGGSLQFNNQWSFEKLGVFFVSSPEYIATH